MQDLNKKLNFLAKFWLKINRPLQYNLYKQTRLFVKSADFNHHLLPIIPQNTALQTFKHSGNSGDIIYALPTVLALKNEKSAEFYLQLNQQGCDKSHPLGGVMLNEKMAEMLLPLLDTQHYIDKVGIFNGQTIDYNLDLLRELPISLAAGDISRWYFHIFNVYADLSKPWINVVPNTQYKDSIILARSERYLNPYFDYSFLKKYPNIVFVGVEKEFQLMKKQVPNAQFVSVNNFLELAQIIAGGKFFIGNQSFPYSLAEAMKTPRILEMCYYAPNVVIHGANGYDVYFQKYLEERVDFLFNS